MKILLSIKPEYVNKILSGEKKYEFRKIGFVNKSVDTVVIYATKPIGKVVGEFKILDIYMDAPKEIWERTKKFAGVEKKFFDAYYNGRETAVAIAVGSVIEYETPKDLKELSPNLSPPQSFCYLPVHQEVVQKDFDFI